MTKFLETLRSFPMGFNRVSDAVPSTPERAAEGRQASPLPFIRKAFLAAVAVLTAADNADAGVFEKQTSSIRYFNNGHVSLKSDLPGHGVFHIKFPNDEGQKFHFPLMKSRRVEILREYHWATPQAAQVYYCNEGLNIMGNFMIRTNQRVKFSVEIIALPIHFDFDGANFQNFIEIGGHPSGFNIHHNKF
jgi:hypothetical protein